MNNDAGLFKKVAVLTGLVMVVGGAEISKVDAATLTQTADMPTIQTDGTGSQSNSATVDFNQFNTALGTLTDVQFTLTSGIDDQISGQGFNPSISATVQIDSVQIGPTGSAAGNSTSVFSFGPTEAALSPPALSFYEGSSTFDVSLLLNVISSESVDAFVTWDFFEGEDALALTYTYPAFTGWRSDFPQRSSRFRYRHQHLILDQARRRWRTRRVNQTTRFSSSISTAG